MTQSSSCSGRFCRCCYGEIAEVVTHVDGLYTLQTKRQGTAHQLNVIWRVLGEQLEEMLIKKRSAIVLDFLHASVKVQHITLFNNSTSIQLKPQLMLLPDFTSKFHLKNVLEMHDAHYHATVPNAVSYLTIASIAGTNRFVVEAAVKDSVREIGKYLQRNAASTLTIDIGVGFLEFKDRTYRMKWSPEFLARMKASVGAAEVVTPYDPPSMTVGGPTAPCRFQKGCTSENRLQSQVRDTVLAESRLTAAELNDGMGSSSYRRVHW
ncbi:CCDC81 eukaryotic HU domain 1/CCDC81 eukaryotic HU domain 2, putative [Leishmania lindenbergi]|uniref:CCDC81 eukaryotic HU domain 1/CCDC81 eukaryotic HU domain 2 n=1 Tax=Leishmania lindenbergi TaxID=651832 RepID=A0AAW2ZSY6_9TRYP